MPNYDILDECVIDSQPVVVYKAVLNEYAGVTHWWMPYLEFKPRGNIPVDREGAIVDISIYPKSRTNSKLSAKVTKIVEAKLIEYAISGDFVGTGKWTFEPTDGKTKVQSRFNVRTNRRLFSLVSPFVDFKKRHSDVLQKGFKALNSYLNRSQG